jgi:hypothetical protein
MAKKTHDPVWVLDDGTYHLMIGPKVEGTAYTCESGWAPAGAKWFAAKDDPPPRKSCDRCRSYYDTHVQKFVSVPELLMRRAA